MGVLQTESALAPIEEIGVRHKLRRFTGVRGLGADNIVTSVCVGLNFDRPTGDIGCRHFVSRSVTLGKTFLGSQMKSNGKTKHMFLDVSECGESIFDTPDP